MLVIVSDGEKRNNDAIVKTHFDVFISGKGAAQDCNYNVEHHDVVNDQKYELKVVANPAKGYKLCAFNIVALEVVTVPGSQACLEKVVNDLFQ